MWTSVCGPHAYKRIYSHLFQQAAVGREFESDGHGGRLNVNPLCRPYRCADGEIVVLLGMESQRHLAAISRALGHPEWSEDSAHAFATPGAYHVRTIRSHDVSLYFLSCSFCIYLLVITTSVLICPCGSFAPLGLTCSMFEYCRPSTRPTSQEPRGDDAHNDLPLRRTKPR